MPRSPFYNSAAWKHLRAAKLAQDPLCQECGELATDVDHIKAINAGGDPLAWSNIQSLCHACHSRRTYYLEVLGWDHVPTKGADPKTGLPLDPTHPWNQKKLARADAKRPGAQLSAQ